MTVLSARLKLPLLHGVEGVLVQIGIDALHDAEPIYRAVPFDHTFELNQSMSLRLPGCI